MDRPYHHGDLRAALIALAEAHIAEHGVESLSVRALAREAGVAHRAAYQHFPDKDGLIAAALTQAYGRLEARLARCNAEAPDEALKNVAEAYAGFAFDEPNMFLAMAGPRVNVSGDHKALEAAIASSWRHVTAPIEKGAASGLFTLGDKRAAAALFWCGLSGVLTQAVLGRLKLKPSERVAFVGVVADRLVAGLKV
jgi:AcrR family transcriptional regulator